MSFHQHTFLTGCGFEHKQEPSQTFCQGRVVTLRPAAAVNKTTATQSMKFDKGYDLLDVNVIQPELRPVDKAAPQGLGNCDHSFASGCDWCFRKKHKRQNTTNTNL
eukprot:38553-Amphidinium_carterae.2